MIVQEEMERKLFAKPKTQHIYDTNRKRNTVDALLCGPEKERWNKSMGMKIKQLAQGNICAIYAMDTINFIPQNEIPRGEKGTYTQFVCDYLLLKPESYQIQCVVGRDRLDCAIDMESPTTNLVEFKILSNSTISQVDKGTWLMSLDLKDFVLATLMATAK